MRVTNPWIEQPDGKERDAIKRAKALIDLLAYSKRFNQTAKDLFFYRFEGAFYTMRKDCPVRIFLEFLKWKNGEIRNNFRIFELTKQRSHMKKKVK
jgi:hypothetical protein